MTAVAFPYLDRTTAASVPLSQTIYLYNPGAAALQIIGTFNAGGSTLTKTYTVQQNALLPVDVGAEAASVPIGSLGAVFQVAPGAAGSQALFWASAQSNDVRFSAVEINQPTYPFPPPACSVLPVSTPTASQVAATSTPTITPVGTCALFMAPLFRLVSQTDVQAIGFLTTMPNTTITATFPAGSPAYPRQAVLLVRAGGGTKGQYVRGTPVSGGYQYSFNDGPLGLAALAFLSPGNAQVGFSRTSATCGGLTREVRWRAVLGDSDDQNGSTDGDDLLPGVRTGAAPSTHIWSFMLNGKRVSFTFRA